MPRPTSLPTLRPIFLPAPPHLPPHLLRSGAPPPNPSSPAAPPTTTSGRVPRAPPSTPAATLLFLPHHPAGMAGSDRPRPPARPQPPDPAAVGPSARNPPRSRSSSPNPARSTQVPLSRAAEARVVLPLSGREAPSSNSPACHRDEVGQEACANAPCCPRRIRRANPPPHLPRGRSDELYHHAPVGGPSSLLHNRRRAQAAAPPFLPAILPPQPRLDGYGPPAARFGHAFDHGDMMGCRIQGGFGRQEAVDLAENCPSLLPANLLHRMPRTLLRQAPDPSTIDAPGMSSARGSFARYHEESGRVRFDAALHFFSVSLIIRFGQRASLRAVRWHVHAVQRVCVCSTRRVGCRWLL
nr:vegetative cell wall protein gp1 isoform X1 [Aegilops tauschii subsp. strangulata]